MSGKEIIKCTVCEKVRKHLSACFKFKHVLSTFTSALQGKNAVFAFQITCKLLSFTLEDFWRN